MTRDEKVVEAQRLREQGLKLREIAERMGVALSTVSQYLHDPDLSKLRARKDSYRGECKECGAPTNGSNGAAAAPSRCIDCYGDRFAERNERLREMWEAEEPTWYIAESLGVTETAVPAWVYVARRRNGESLSLRRIGGSQEERKARHKRMLELRRKGLSNGEIAEVIGMAGAASVSTAFTNLRRKGVRVPPAHRPKIEVMKVAA